LASGRLPGQFDVERSEVDEVNLVAPRGQPAGMATRPAADVEDRGRRRRQETPQQLAGAFAIQLASALMQPVGLVARRVVGGDRFGPWGRYHSMRNHALLSPKAAVHGESLAHRENHSTSCLFEGYQHAREGSPFSEWENPTDAPSCCGSSGLCA